METYRTFDFPGGPRGLEPFRSVYEKRLSAVNKYTYHSRIPLSNNLSIEALYLKHVDPDQTSTRAV